MWRGKSLITKLKSYHLKVCDLLFIPMKGSVKKNPTKETLLLIQWYLKIKALSQYFKKYVILKLRKTEQHFTNESSGSIKFMCAYYRKKNKWTEFAQ